MIKKANLFKKLAKKLKERQEGVALIEFALATPVLSLLLLGCVDLTVYLVAHQRIARSSYTMSNLITQMDDGLTESQVSDMMLALDQVSKPFDIQTDGIATITAIIGNGTDGAAPDNYTVAWKRCYGAGAPSTTYGNAGSPVAQADFPVDSIVTTGQILVVAEVDYTYTPILGFLPLDGVITYKSYFRPRRGTIENITADGSAAQVCA